MKNLVIFLCLVISFILSACSFKKSDAANSSDQQFEETNNMLKAEYKSAEGLYRGEIKRPGYLKTIPVDIRLVVISDDKEPGASGKKRQLASLLGVVTQIETNKDNLEMTTTFDSDSGRLSLSNTQNSDIAYIEGSLVNGHISGVVKARQGILGQLEAERASISPDLETLTEKMARYDRFYQKVVGIYDAVMVLQFTSGPTDTPVRFSITPGTVEKPGLGVSCYSGSFGQAPMNIIYRTEEDTSYLSLSALSSANGTPVSAAGGTCVYTKLEGRLIEDKVYAEVTSIMGDVQQLVFTRRKK